MKPWALSDLFSRENRSAQVFNSTFSETGLLDSSRFLPSPTLYPKFESPLRPKRLA